MADVSISQSEPLTVAFKHVRGPYALIPQSFGELYHWVEHFGLEPAGPPQALYISDPNVTPPDDVEWELWAPVAGGAGGTGPDEEGFGIKTVESALLASALYVGAWDAIGPFYHEVMAWLGANGYAPAGPFREVYFDGPEVPPEKNRTQVLIPVAPVG